MKKALIFGSLVFSVVQCLAATLDMVTCHAGAQPYNAKGESGGPFYGYKTDSEGPGDDAFTLCLEGARKYHAPLFLILDKDGSGSATFINTANDKRSEFGDRYLNKWINKQRASYNTRFCYFRGMTAKACKDAWEFATKCGVPSGSFVYVAYYCYKDGTEQIQCGTMGTVQGFEGVAAGFAAKYNLSKDKTKEIMANADFACGSGPNSGLQMVSNETKQIYVPFVRKENLTNVETNWLAVTYPGEDAVSTNIQFAWEATGPAATNLEVAVSVSNRWVEGGKIRLEYLNKDRISFITNWISCVTVTNGTFDLPWLPGERTADELGWGEWTLDFAAATNRARQTGGVTVAVLGSPVWTDAGALFGSAANHAVVTNFCKNANATLAIIDHADAKGASLFSHVIEDGWSGTPFLSRHGFSLKDAAVTGLRAEHNRLWGEYQTENDPDKVEVAVFRTDGTRVGMLKIQRTTSGDPTNWDENLARLVELIDTANGEYESDRYEDVNNKPQAGVAEIAYSAAAAMLTETNSLSISDRYDFFKLSGLEAKKPLTVSLVDCNEAKRTQKSGIAVSVVCVTNAAKNLYQVLEPAASSNVWIFADDEISSAYVRVAAWQSRETKDSGPLASAGNSKVTYRVQVASAPDDVGTIGFVTESDTIEVTENEMAFPIKVKRTGYTGAATATLSLDTELTTAPALSFSFPASVSATWNDVEWDERTIDGLKFLNNGDWDEGGDIVLTLVTSGAELVGTNKLWLTVTQKEDPSKPTGKIVISSPSTAERVYAEAGTDLAVLIDRIGGKRGPLAVKVSVPDGKVSTNRLDWSKYNVQQKAVTWTLPALAATQPYRNASFRLTGIDGTPVASNTLNVCVLPAGALKPETGDYRTAIAQYCELTDAKVGFVGELPDGATLTPMRIAGSLPPGVGTPKVDAAKNLVFSGISSKPGTYASTWWLAVRNAKRQLVGYSYPVKVTISVEALAVTDKQGQVIGGVNTNFAKARTWSTLPLTAYPSGRLEGLLDLTVAKTGKMSARYRRAGGKTVSFSARGLTHVDLESGLANADASASGYQLKVRLYADSSVAGDVYGPEIDGQRLHFETLEGSVAWSKDNPSEAWKGSYTVAFAQAGEWDAKTLCFGSPVLQLKFTSKSQWNAGKVTYAGYLPNGKAISGSATLLEMPVGGTAVSLPIFATSVTDTLSTMVDLDSDQSAVVPSVTTIKENEILYQTQVTSYWAHVEANVSELSYRNLYLPFGSKFADKGWKAADFEAAVEGATSAQYNKTTGLVSGSLRRTAGGKTVAETWKAVVTPGWEVLLGGASWRNVLTNAVNDATGKSVRRSVAVGDAIEIPAAE